MTNQGKSVSFPLPPSVMKAILLLNESGHEAYVVGGAVRDLLRGVIPNDYDITTSATPEEMKGVFSAFRTIETGIAHGTLTVLIEGEPLEITTFRVDGNYTDSRHPDAVTFTRSLREDAARRDFTVNAMAYHPREGLFDFFGGAEDLKAGILRTVGDSRRRFTEDALRILRALRFSAVLGYRIEKETALAVHELAPTLTHVAAERIREEFVKLLISEHAAEILRENSDAIAVFLPEIKPLIGFEQHSLHHDHDVWEHTLHALEMAPRVLSLRLAVLLHDFGKPFCHSLDEKGEGHFYGHAEKSAELADEILRRLRFDNETREYVTSLVKMHDVLPKPETRQFGRIRSRHGDQFLLDWLSVIRADRMGQKHIFPPEVAQKTEEAEEAARALLATEERISLSSLAVRGDDMIALGYRGREIGAALSRALDGVIDQKTENTKEALIAYLTKKDAPIECERKFLIAYPDKTHLMQIGAEASEITQTYLLSEKGTTARVRRRIFRDKTEYTHTRKTRISALSAREEEREITLTEYEALLLDKDPARIAIEKTRYTLPYGDHLLEIDIYPFWQKQAVLEIELSEENEVFSLPNEITILREVTEDVAYKNAALARHVPEED